MLARYLVVSAIATTAALQPPVPLNSRRAVLGAGTASLIGVVSPGRAHALKPCPPGANNCWSTASKDKTKLALWSFPSGTDRTGAVKQVREVLESYPQAGQAGVDAGGWQIAEDALDSDGFVRVEFKSGIGNFAKFFNGGKPFVDDLELALEDSGMCVRSSSRVGDSDFGVNAKRINYIAAGLTKLGWNAPGVTI